MPRVASATEPLASNPIALTPTVAPPSFIPWSMYCSKGMLRLAEMNHIDLPRNVVALNDEPAGCQELCGASACCARRWASETLALPELLVCSVDVQPQAARMRHPVPRRSLNLRIRIVDLLISMLLVPGPLDIEPPSSRKARDGHRQDQ